MSKLPDIAAMDAAKRSQLRANAERLCDKGTESQKSQAAAVMEELRRIEVNEEASRREAIANLGRVERVVNAFKVMPLTEGERKLLQVVLDNPGATSAQMDAAIGWNNGWHMHFGKLAGAREHLLWPANPVPGQDRDYKGGILVDFNDDSRGIAIKAEVAEGLSMIGIKSSSHVGK